MSLKQSDFDEAYDIEVLEAKSVRISLHLIAKRHLPPDSAKWPQEKILEALNQISHLRLDRENIETIDNLELLGNSVKNVYLQMNRIKCIENLETLSSMRFLTLADNKIQTIEGLKLLNKLGFLDLSNNQIETVDVDELPQSLVILNLKGNPCTELPDYRGRIVQDMAGLRQLDGEDVTREERREAGYTLSSSEEEEEEDDDVDTPGGDAQQMQDNISNITNMILLRSQNRVEDTQDEHKHKMTQLQEIRSNQLTHRAEGD